MRSPAFVIASLLLTLLPPAAHAGDDAFLRDYAETRGFMLGRPVNATPTPDGSAVLFLRARGPRDPSQELYEYNVATGQTRRLLAPENTLKGSAEHLSPEERARRERQRISVGGFTSFSISRDSALVLLGLSGKLYVLRRADGHVTALATGAGTILDPKFSPDSRSVAYVRDQDVCVFDLAAGKEHAVTTGGTETLAHGQAEFVAQEEMERYSGYWWSPDSKRIAYQENDASKVETWSAADPALPGNAPERSFYPRPGKENVAVRLGIVPADGSGAPTTWLEWDRAHYPYLGKVTWTERGPLTLTVLTRDQTGLALLTADPDTGKTTALLTEHDDAWVPLAPDVPVWLSEENGGGFLWASDARGGRELELRAADGHLDRVLPAGPGAHPPAGWRDNLRTVFGVAGSAVFASYSGPTPFSAPLSIRQELAAAAAAPADLMGGFGDGGTAHDAGLALANLGESETVFTLQRQTPGRMPWTQVRRVSDLAVLCELPSVALEPPFVPNATLDPLDLDDPAASEHDQGFASQIIRPRDFDPDAKRRYPVIVDVYGGPGHQQVVASMRPYLLDQWLADQGFIVAAIDGRGTPGRGRDWERAIAGHFGSVPLDDQVEALKRLGARYPEMDLDRVGITGWSFGGYMAALAVLRRPDVFKAAVAGAPVVDWMDYDTCYTERYLGVPGAGRWPEAYAEGSLLTYADGLSRPLLLIHGTADDNVFFRHSLRLAQELFRAGKPFDFLPLSSFTHMVPDPVVRTRLEERIADYFHAHLSPAPPVAFQ